MYRTNLGLRTALICLVLLSTRVVEAGLISLTAAPLSADGSEIFTSGELLYAWNVNSEPGDPAAVVNGIAFSSMQPSQISFSGLPAAVQNAAGTSAHYTGTGLPQLMGDMRGTNANSDGLVTLGGLTVGTEYQVQFLHHQDINQTNGRNMQILFGNSLSDPATATFGVGNNQGYITSARFVADASSQDFFFRTVSGRSILNGVAVTAVATPEPSSLVLGTALLLFGTVVVRRRQRRV